jgi:serine/threonine-protein kinase RsbW/stage II sporulation protein AB (anti-sigma F factor)
MRTAVGQLASRLGADRDRRFWIELAVSEALTNAVVHAFVGRPTGHITLEARCEPDLLTVVVEDDGGGMGPRIDSPGLGVGLGLVARASDGLEVVDAESGGTRLSMRFTVRGHVSAYDPRR